MDNIAAHHQRGTNKYIVTSRFDMYLLSPFRGYPETGDTNCFQDSLLAANKRSNERYLEPIPFPVGLK